jgi:uncharacterized protein (DUF2126 family)
MLDGRHTGTGGGNHFVLGGATPADARSCAGPTCWPACWPTGTTTPALSYLFSGLFIGPTSQAPRVDEARNDQLYELEIALGEIERNRDVTARQMPPWLVDRTLRNMLVDVTGNTHRSEFCIDKLYSPDAATGRLGLLELRAFEMPPHARMSLVQQLLLRSLVARFWKASPTRRRRCAGAPSCTTASCCRTFVEEDLRRRAGGAARAGYGFDARLVRAALRVPLPEGGRDRVRGMHLTLRNALEPWHVMGEEGAPGGTVRYVDSSLERIEVRWRAGETAACGHLQRRAGAAAADRHGGRVCGRRALPAWQPPSCLHPSIGVHAPLVSTWWTPG